MANSKQMIGSRRWLLLVVAIMLGLSFVYFYQSSAPEVREAFVAEDVVFDEDVGTLKRPELLIVKPDGDSIKVDAQTAGQSEAETDFVGSDLRGELTIGGGNWEITSSSGRVPVGNDRIILIDEVTGVLDDDLQITSDEIIAFIDEDKLVSNDRVEVQSSRLDAVADSASIEGKVGEMIVVFEGNVSGRIHAHSASGKTDEDVVDEQGEVSN